MRRCCSFNFDGGLGSSASIEVLQFVRDTRRPLTVVMCSSAAGKANADEWKLASRGMTEAEAIRRIGVDPRTLIARCSRVEVGVVDGIVSID